MKIAVAGGGPAGLYCAALVKRSRPQWNVTVFERNAADATYGFGVVFSDQALDFLKADDAQLARDLVNRFESWPNLKIVHQDKVLSIDGNGFSGIARIDLLGVLQQQARGLGVKLKFNQQLDANGPPIDADLVIAADGANSGFRHPGFKPRRRTLHNFFIWYGTTRPFDSLTLTFRACDDGYFVAHHYRYSTSMSTFIVECDPATWHRAGFAGMDDSVTRRYCEKVFAQELAGHPLCSNNSRWRNFPLISTGKWHCDNVVLIGDALRTVHFSIGSGTRLAMEDAAALARCLSHSHSDLQGSLKEFESGRRPIVEKILDGARNSSWWYQDLRNHMQLPPEELAYSYMTRSGRVDDARLRSLAPGFMAGYDAYISNKQNHKN